METKITFDAYYKWAWLRNIGNGDAYVSKNPNIIAETKDTAFLPAGEAVMLEINSDSVYIVGNTTIEAHGQEYPDPPVLDNVSIGGDAIKPTLKDITITENGTYTIPAGFDGYGTITVNIEE